MNKYSHVEPWADEILFALSSVVECPGNEDHTSCPKGSRVTHPTVFLMLLRLLPLDVDKSFSENPITSTTCDSCPIPPAPAPGMVSKQELRNTSQKLQALVPALVPANCGTLDMLLSPSQLQFHHQDKSVQV